MEFSHTFLSMKIVLTALFYCMIWQVTQKDLGAVSILMYRPANKGSHHLKFVMKIPYPVRLSLYWDGAPVPWWRHRMETFSALLAICAGNSSVSGEFPTQRPVTRNFDVFFDLCPNEWLSKHSWGWWLETQSSPLWRHNNALAEDRQDIWHPAILTRESGGDCWDLQVNPV